MSNFPEKQGLYNPLYEHDACGIGAIAQIKGIRTHQTIKDALNILIHLEHRGGTGAENNSGDGAGILLQIPDKFFRGINLNFILPEEGDYAVGQLFLNQNNDLRQKELNIINKSLKDENIEILGFRKVPCNEYGIGKSALKTMPYIAQLFVKRPCDINRGIDFERKIYLARKIIEKEILKEHLSLYFCSFSTKTIIYKGMLVSTQVADFYIDLKDTRMETAIALVHSRFSTNTFPSWERAHPYRYLCHNGEINTIRGNVNAVKARESLLKSEVFKEDLKKIIPLIPVESSDSAMFDNLLEFLYLNGRTLEETVMTMIPEPWEKSPNINEDLKAFYQFHSTYFEPWDGPAALIFTDGTKLGASLDRNGLRPSRYYVTKDDYLILFSETGSLPIDEANVLEKRRLEPGKILLVDTEKGRIIANDEVKSYYANAHPYKEWVKNIIYLDNIEEIKEEDIKFDLHFKHVENNYVYDEVMEGILPLSSTGNEKASAMGSDIPLAFLSDKPFNLFQFFKQRFAQVTNPPIDAIREDIVMSSSIYLGKEGNMLNPNQENARRICLKTPILTKEEFHKIKHISETNLKVEEISIRYDDKKEDLSKALDRICLLAEKKVDEGVSILILSDREDEGIVIPSLLAVSAIHLHLVKKAKRTHTSLVLQSAEPREIHHFACLIGFGVNAIYPYLAYETIKEYQRLGYLKIEVNKAINNYINGVTKAIIKIISKMGISTIQSYNGAQIFEIVGLSDEVVEKYFTATPSAVGGINIEQLEENQKKLHEMAKIDHSDVLISTGLHGYRKKQHDHLYDPQTIYHLQTACRENNYQEFKEFTRLLNEKVINIRDTFEFNYANSISIDEVESVESIVKRFKTGAMSYGSISKEAHECMAIAMNQLGGKSNTGEGGEESSRYKIGEDGLNRCSQIKQIASGRFGVTIDYLTSANEIQIKMAQGAKPGEGGQLPGTKVYPWIAKARYSTPGVTLISPPPHHDIYSIEDLAQLIFDLKNANRGARISVKLVAESGVGTVAAGVVKAGANTVLISGYDGGTGASPRTSINNAGVPWEIGISETHQTLVLNNLRDRVCIETDGKLLTGKDLATAILLGAEEFGFATGPLIAMGCVMMRVCNLNTCPMGIATQNETLRKNFKGKPEYVMNFMRFIAQELREYMAYMGFRTINEMVGRTEFIRVKEQYKKRIDVSKLLFNHFACNRSETVFKAYKPHGLENTMDYQVLLPLCKETILNKSRKKINLEISNVNRAFGTILSNEIAKIYGEDGLDDDAIIINARGNAGNSFGAFLIKGISIFVSGDANDYLGKGLSGGKIVVKPSLKATFSPEKNIICGNVCLYGATSGEVYLEGIAGERFAVRNSGASIVSLGCGQHGLEYMTGGKALVLGPIGTNFASGMSGGIAYVYNKDNIKNVNLDLVSIKDVDEKDVEIIKDLMKKHIEYTSSKYVEKLLNKFDANDYFKVLPNDYAKIISLIEEAKNQGVDNPELVAFNRFMEVK